MLKDTLRWADLVSRTEDSRFVFVLPETDKEAAVLLARKINANITELHISYENVELPVSACFGVSAWEKGNDSVLLLRHANQSLELAKNNGPGSVQDC
jgi:diguanylate cyclase (GGDEF)-like protein